MERQVKLNLRQKNGEYKEHIIDFVPYSKRQEYIRLEADLEKRVDENGNPVIATEAEYDELQLNFVAKLFGLAPNQIADGLDAADRRSIYEIIRYRVLGFDKEEDEAVREAAKKAQLDELLAGVNSTISNLDSSEM